MAESLRRSSRPVKLRREAEFLYDEESVRAVFGSRSETWQHRPSSDSTVHSDSGIREENKVENNLVDASEGWSVLHSVLNISHSSNTRHIEVDNLVRHKGRRSQRQSQNSTADEIVLQCLVDADVNSSGSSVNISGFRTNSSTRYSFLDLDQNYLTVSPADRTQTSDMGLSDGEGSVEHEASGSAAVTSEANATETSDLIKALREALGKIDKLSDKVDSLEKGMLIQNNRIGRLEGASSQGSESEGSRHRGSKEKSTKDDSRKVKGKKDRIEFEKERQYSVVKDKISSRNKNKNRYETEEESEEEVDLKGVRKKMSRKQRDEASHRMSSRLRQAGGVFPVEDEEASASSGRDSGDSWIKSRKEVKSGAKVKKRPVVQTELWPHTIANEEDGEEVTSESIGLAKFYSCFTYIMVNCGRREAAGRSVLLHAVSLVLEYLPWTDARTFHNTIMVKVEQGRISWATDFSDLAEQFIDKKVRLTLRAKGAASYIKPSQSSRNYGKGYGNSNNRYYNNSTSGKNKSLYSFVCWQWNNGSCSYGDKCRKWHVCWSCAEDGKLGESHKSSSHGNSGFRGRPAQGDQRA